MYVCMYVCMYVLQCICSAPFKNLRFLGIPKKHRLSTESAATESAMDPALSTTMYYKVTGYSVARIICHVRGVTRIDRVGGQDYQMCARSAPPNAKSN